MSILEEIVAYKKIEVDRSKMQPSLDKLKKLLNEKDIINNYFSKKLKEKIDKKEIGLIAEVKKASPSKGIIKEDFDPIKISLSFFKGGATCLSVLTDTKYFHGSLDYIQGIKKEVHLPILRKDFIIDPYQIYESIYYSSDCILLIVSVLDIDMLKRLYELSAENNLDCLIEVHDEKELEIALSIFEMFNYIHLLGINNRNLKTFEVDIKTTKKLVSKYNRDLRGKILISESGIFTSSDIRSLVDFGVYSFLVGEALVKEDDIEKATKRLLLV